jgi:tRNA-binding protein
LLKGSIRAAAHPAVMVDERTEGQPPTSTAFFSADIRAGTIRAAAPLPGAHRPAYRLEVDFGASLGCRVSTAQLTTLYEPADLVGKQVMGVVNLPPKRVAGVQSEVLIVGVADESGAVVLVTPERRVPDGARLY